MRVLKVIIYLLLSVFIGIGCLYALFIIAFSWEDGYMSRENKPLVFLTAAITISVIGGFFYVGKKFIRNKVILVIAGFLLLTAAIFTLPVMEKIADFKVNTEKTNAVDHDDESVNLLVEKQQTSSTDHQDNENIFFFKKDISQVNYSGKFGFDEYLENTINLNISQVAHLKNGILYELKLDFVEGIPNDRLNLGYFYVQKEVIYRMEPTKDNLDKLKLSDEIPKDSVIVCQDKEMKDSLDKNERGWHHYIDINGDMREYHAYNNLVETGYYESLTWEKHKGLIFYQSGYGAERDMITIQIN